MWAFSCAIEGCASLWSGHDGVSLRSFPCGGAWAPGPGPAWLQCGGPAARLQGTGSVAVVQGLGGSRPGELPVIRGRRFLVLQGGSLTAGSPGRPHCIHFWIRKLQDFIPTKKYLLNRCSLSSIVSTRQMFAICLHLQRCHHNVPGGWGRISWNVSFPCC